MIDARTRFRPAAAATSAALVAAMLLVHLLPMAGLPLIYFVEQDEPVLIGGIALLLVAPFASRIVGDAPLRLGGPTAAALIALAALFAWAGARAVFDRYDLSRDEVLATLAARHLSHGLLYAPIPPEWRAYAPAMMPLYMIPVAGNAGWAGQYLPAAAAIRAAFLMLGDAALTGPALLALGLAAGWRLARRLFVDRPEAAAVALLLMVASPQLLVNAMTAYAMTAHFALNMVWLALWRRGGRAHLGAMAVALVATGLHQAQFHPLFAAPFVLHLWFAGGRRWAAAYVAAYLGIAIVWFAGWPALLATQVAAPDMAGAGTSAGGKFAGLIGRVVDATVPLRAANLARFFAWQPILLAPLALLAWVPVRRGEGIARPLAAACLIGLVASGYQGHGWGYRYMHGFIGAWALLAAYGWRELATGSGARALVRYGVAVTLMLALPFQLWRAEAWVAPMIRADRAIRALPADVVLIDSRHGFFAEDLVRSDGDFTRRPLLMDLAWLDEPRLDRLCRRYRLATWDRRHFDAVGLRHVDRGVWDGPTLVRLRAWLARRRCAPAAPMP